MSESTAVPTAPALVVATVTAEPALVSGADGVSTPARAGTRSSKAAEPALSSVPQRALLLSASGYSLRVLVPEYLGANATDGQAVIVPGVAHMIGLEAPEELGSLIAEFLAPLPRWA